MLSLAFKETLFKSKCREYGGLQSTLAAMTGLRADSLKHNHSNMKQRVRANNTDDA